MIETERLILRNYLESDIDDYFEYVSNPNIGPRAGGWKPYETKEAALERLRHEITKPYQFAIVLKEENKVIGSVELMDVKVERYGIDEVDNTKKEIGYLLSESYWGRGIMPEAVKGVMEYAFMTLKVEEILISHAKANVQSGRVQDKLGFKIFAEMPNYRTWVDGKETSCVCRSMTREEYIKNYKNNKR